MCALGAAGSATVLLGSGHASGCDIEPVVILCVVWSRQSAGCLSFLAGAYNFSLRSPTTMMALGLTKQSNLVLVRF